MTDRPTKVLILFNHTGEDEYEKMRAVSPDDLGFTPTYPIHVATALDEYQALAKGLESEGFEAVLGNLEDDFARLLRLLEKEKPDVVFNLVEHFRGDSKLEMMVAGVFDLMSIPYTGATPFALALCQRKGLTKQILLANGIPTPRFRLLTAPVLPRRHGLHYPMIVKPGREDASWGVDRDAVVHGLEELTARIEHAFKEFGSPILVEEFIEGRELHVGILGNHPPRMLPIVEYDFSELPPEEPRIISYDVKWNPLSENYHKVHANCPAELSKRLQKRVEAACLRAYELTGCRDYARLDVRVSSRGQVQILEVNPNPDLTEGVSFMDSAEKAGLSFSATLRMIVEFALARKSTALATHRESNTPGA